MTNKEKLINLMKQYGIHKVFYPPYMDLNDDRPVGELLFAASENTKFMAKVYEIYTDEGIVELDRYFYIRMMPDGDDNLEPYKDDCTEVLYV